MSSIPWAGTFLLVSLFFSFVFLSTGGDLSAQGLGGGVKSPAPPSRPQPKAPGNSAGGARKPKPTTTKDLDEARKRRSEKRGREESSRAETPVAPAGGLPFRFESFSKGDIRVLSTSWKTEERKGRKPFTVVSVRIANQTGSWISMKDVILTGQHVTPLDSKDERPLPVFPLRLNRFSGQAGVPLPVPPRGLQTITFTLCCAVKSTSVLRAEAGECLRFRLERPFDWNPVRVIDFKAVPTSSNGRPHKGLFVTLENEADHPVRARLKIALDGLPSLRGGTYFYSALSLRVGERKTLVLRTIPDESLPSGDPDRNTMPSDFQVRSVEVADMQF